MDPTACFNSMVSAFEAGDYETAVEAADNLVNWLRRGGFQPEGISAKQALRRAKSILRESRQFAE